MATDIMLEKRKSKTTKLLKFSGLYYIIINIGKIIGFRAVSLYKKRDAFILGF